MNRESLKKNIKNTIASSQEVVFMPKDFFYLSDRDQVGRVFRQLTKEAFLYKVGYGVYVRTKISKYTGKTIPSADLREIAEITMRKLGVDVIPTASEQKYMNRETTQVPNRFVLGVNKRVSRRLQIGKASIKYEKVR